MLSREELIEDLLQGTGLSERQIEHVLCRLKQLGIFPLKLSEEEIEARAEAVRESCIRAGDSPYFASAARALASFALRDLSKPIPPVKSWEAAAEAFARAGGSTIDALKAARPLMPGGGD